MKRFYTLLLLVACVVIAQAQKIDSRLTELVQQSVSRRAQGLAPLDAKAVNKEIAVRFNADGSINTLSAIATLKEGAECPTEKLEQMGIEVRFVLGDMVALRIPADKLQLLEPLEEFIEVKADEMKHVMNDEARKAVGVNMVDIEAAAKSMGLPQAYTGKDVVVGVIDDGIDFNHAAFRDANGNTRIRKAVEYISFLDMMEEYEPSVISEQLSSDLDETSHGTHTSATAAGSDIGNNMQGMAPDADLVLVGLGGATSDANIVEGIQRIFDYADAVKKPAVVNISLGGIAGLHDGSDDLAKGIAKLTENGTKPGRAVVVSSGNSAAEWQSIIKKFPNTTDELKTVLGASNITDKGLAQYSETYYLYATDYQDFTPTLTMVDFSTGNFVDMTGHVKDKQGENVNLSFVKLYKSIVKTIKGTDAIIWRISFRRANVFLDNIFYRLAITVKAGHADQTINMICTGDNNLEPCFDTPKTATGYDFAANGWTKGHSDFACNTAICNDAVISVGAYVTKTSWTNYQNEGYNYPKSGLTGDYQQLGEIADFSSYCIDDNGQPRPTLIAPGQGVLSAANNYDKNFFKASEAGIVNPNSSRKARLCSNVEKFGRQNWYILSQGTSMSTPVVTGVVALWMQANPKLTAKEIINIMKETCDNDEWTTNVNKIPSHNKVQAGFGKINCLKGLKKITGATAIDVVTMDGQRQATPATMYSVDAPVYNMMGQQVDKAQKGLVIYKGKKYLNK